MGRFDAEYIEGLKPHTARRYRVSVRALHPILGNLFLDEIGKEALSKVERLHDMAVLGSMFRQAVNWGWVDLNPVRSFDKRALPRAKNRRRFLTEAEVGRLKKEALPDLQRMIVFAVETGMRLGEILSLKWTDVDPLRREVTLRDTKNNEPRVIPLSPEAIKAAGTKPGTGHVFGSTGGKRRREDTIGHRFQRLCKRAKVTDATFHDLRHTFASWALQGRFKWQSGPFDIPRLMRWLGHKQISQTMRYAHLATDDLQALVKRGRAQKRAQGHADSKGRKRKKTQSKQMVAAEGLEPPTKGL